MITSVVFSCQKWYWLKVMTLMVMKSLVFWFQFQNIFMPNVVCKLSWKFYSILILDVRYRMYNGEIVCASYMKSNPLYYMKSIILYMKSILLYYIKSILLYMYFMKSRFSLIQRTMCLLYTCQLFSHTDGIQLFQSAKWILDKSCVTIFQLIFQWIHLNLLCKIDNGIKFFWVW